MRSDAERREEVGDYFRRDHRACQFATSSAAKRFGLREDAGWRTANGR